MRGGVGAGGRVRRLWTEPGGRPPSLLRISRCCWMVRPFTLSPFTYTLSSLIKGDMVIEYVGDLLRPSVVELREKALYNDMVGVGTYVFK